MSLSVSSSDASRARTTKGLSLAQRVSRNAVAGRLSGLRGGCVRLSDVTGTENLGESGWPLIALVVHDPRFYYMVVRGGPNAFAEAYLRGWWTTDDLPGLLRLFARNIGTARRARGGLARCQGAIDALSHALRPNSKRGSRRNIASHYDLGNDLFKSFLDPTMTYSCGYFERPDSTLHEASVAKLDLICKKLGLSAGEQVLEIGTGWGSFAIHAAREYGCHVTTTTISCEQHELAAERVCAAGLQDRVTLLQTDYRELSGTFDKLVSIEMIEAVGHANLPMYFGKCADLLKSGGEMLLQAISMPDHAYRAYLRNADFIQRYVFPGSCCPSPGAIAEAVARDGRLRMFGHEDITSHYVRTLRAWHEQFREGYGSLPVERYPERFRRLWEYYLSYCEAGFAEEYISTAQYHLRRCHLQERGGAD